MSTFDGRPIRAVTALFLGRVGDVIVATPFLRALRARFPEARVRLVVSHRSVQVLPLIPFIDASAVLGRAGDVRGHLRLARELFTRSEDLLVDLNPAPSRTAYLLARAVRSPAKLSFRKGRLDSLFTHRVEAPGEREHMLERYARLAAALGAPYSPELELRVSPEDERRGEELLRALPPGASGRLRVLIHPGNFDRFAFRWPEEKFIDLTNRLLQDPRLEIVYMGGPGEGERVRALTAKLDRPVGVLPPAPLGAVAAVLKRTDVFVCNPTGTTHLAAAVGARTFTLNAGYTYAVWRPLGPRHGGVASDTWKSSREIPVGAAHRALARFIESVRAS